MLVELLLLLETWPLFGLCAAGEARRHTIYFLPLSQTAALTSGCRTPPASAYPDCGRGYPSTPLEPTRTGTNQRGTALHPTSNHEKAAADHVTGWVPVPAKSGTDPTGYSNCRLAVAR